MATFHRQKIIPAGKIIVTNFISYIVKQVRKASKHQWLLEIALKKTGNVIKSKTNNISMVW